MNLKTFVFFIALFSTVCIVVRAQDAVSLIGQGRILLEKNKTDSAVACFEKALVLDSKNYDALVLLCNYYFLVGKMELDKIETAYLAQESPTRMQVAQYNEDLKSMYAMYYSKAEKYLIQAYLIRRNDYLDEVAGQIADFKERIGIRTPGDKKNWFIKKLLP
jgi:tetratricopeptide (TPR) repeat protein